MQHQPRIQKLQLKFFGNKAVAFEDACKEHMTFQSCRCGKRFHGTCDYARFG